MDKVFAFARLRDVDALLQALDGGAPVNWKNEVRLPFLGSLRAFRNAEALIFCLCTLLC